MTIRSALVFAGLCLVASQGTPPPTRNVTVVNPTDVERPAETITLAAPALVEALQVKDIRTVHVRDEKSGQDLLTQAVDLNDDGTFDELIFQADLAANETRRFSPDGRGAPHPEARGISRLRPLQSRAA